MGLRSRLVAATMTGLMVTAAAGTTAAAEAKPAASQHSEGKKPDKDLLAKVAAGLKVSVQQLTKALATLKQALAKGTGKAQAVAAFAKELKVTVADAERALQVLAGGKDEPGAPEEVIKLLARDLKISAERAKQVVEDLAKVKARGDAIRQDPAFIGIAEGLGITPKRLLDVLIQVKKQVGREAGEPTGTK